MRMWQTIRAASLQRHVHRRAYAALVLSGSYEEAGDMGRICVRAGDVVLHDAFEAHLNLLPTSSASVLNISLPNRHAFQPGLGGIDDPDSIIRVAEKNEAAAAALILSSVRLREPERRDWPDDLAVEILQNPSLNLTRWSMDRAIAPWTLSRGFAQVFDISPCAFRARVRTRGAWKEIRATTGSLAAIAAHCGFADQSHMTRSVKSMTGKSPHAWRVIAYRPKTG